MNKLTSLLEIRPGYPKQQQVPLSGRARNSLYIHVLCVWKKSINNIAGTKNAQ